jgi:putative membrane protein insertion efficiency factor
MLVKLSIMMIKAYQICLSPYLPHTCRYYPSCSQYTIDAMRKYGFLKGLYRSVRRILTCHPFHPGGIDPA